MKSLESCYTLRNGVEIPVIGFGTWQTPDGDVAESSVRTAIEAGYRHIDTASEYHNEESVGRGIHSSGIPREQLFITTKLWNADHGYESTLKAFDLSMKRLGLDYCDLYLIHWPNPVMFRDCWQQKNAESWKAMEKLLEEGRIRAIGISNFLPHHIDALLKTANIMPAVEQMKLNPTLLQNEVREYCEKLGMVVEAYSPLGTGKVLSLPEICGIAAAHGKSAAQVCVRWSLQKGFLPLPKSVTPERIRSNAEVFDFALSDDEMARLDALDLKFGPFRDPDATTF